MCFKQCKKHPICCISTLIVVVLIVNILILLTMEPQIVFEPQKLDVSLSPGENFTKTISIGAIGRGDIDVTLKATESIKGYVNLTEKPIPVVVGRTYYVNVRFENILMNTTPSEYRGAIQISHNDKPKAEIPVFIKIHKTMVQIAGIEAPLKVNKSDYFKITAKIKNMGDYDALWVTANASATSTKLDLINDQTEKIPIIHKNEEVSADWWFKATEAGESTITVNLTSKNADRDTEIIPVKIVQSKKPS